MPKEFKENRVKVHEVKEGNVVIEVYKKVNEFTSTVYFDYRTNREFVVGESDMKRGPFCQQRDGWDNAIALAKVMGWISEQHRNIRRGNHI